MGKCGTVVKARQGIPTNPKKAASMSVLSVLFLFRSACYTFANSASAAREKEGKGKQSWFSCMAALIPHALQCVCTLLLSSSPSTFKKSASISPVFSRCSITTSLLLQIFS